MTSLSNMLWGYTGSLGMPVRGNEIANKLARDGSVQRFVRPEPLLGISKQNIRKKDETLDGKTASGIVAWSL
jgi:hypothetical protein